jgi:hypothetical protein
MLWLFSACVVNAMYDDNRNAIIGSAAAGFFSRQHPDQDRGGASDALVYLDGAEWAVHGAGAAFHAAVEVGDSHLAIVRLKHPVRAYAEAHPATRAFLGIVLERGHILQVFHAASPFNPRP